MGVLGPRRKKYCEYAKLSYVCNFMYINTQARVPLSQENLANCCHFRPNKLAHWLDAHIYFLCVAVRELLLCALYHVITQLFGTPCGAPRSA